MTEAIVKCRQCEWSETMPTYNEGILPSEEGYIPDASRLSALLKSAWSIGLEHAWDNRGHVVETFVDGKVKATQQVADMSPWHDHRSLIAEEGIE